MALGLVCVCVECNGGNVGMSAYTISCLSSLCASNCQPFVRCCKCSGVFHREISLCQGRIYDGGLYSLVPNFRGCFYFDIQIMLPTLNIKA